MGLSIAITDKGTSMELSDLEICQKVADIEDTKFLIGELGEHKGKIYYIWQHSERYGIILQKEYNPLLNDGLCFRLMNKYDISLQQDGDGMFWVAGRGIADNLYKSPNKAVCLAIIEKYKNGDSNVYKQIEG